MCNPRQIKLIIIIIIIIMIMIIIIIIIITFNEIGSETIATKINLFERFP